MHPIEHAESSARRFGGHLADYLDIHSWFDASKEHHADFRHRALRHHAQGIFEAERKFGTAIVNSEGTTVPVRVIGEQHVQEDLGRIPSLSDWLSCIRMESWMLTRRNRCTDSGSTTTDPQASSEVGPPCQSTPVASAIPWTTSSAGSL